MCGWYEKHIRLALASPPQRSQNLSSFCVEYSGLGLACASNCLSQAKQTGCLDSPHSHDVTFEVRLIGKGEAKDERSLTKIFEKTTSDSPSWWQ